MESELEARTAALEASVSAAAGVSMTKTGAAGGPSGTGSAEVNGALDLAALLGVEESTTGSSGTHHPGSTTGTNKDATRRGQPAPATSSSNNQINVQMINILQSQRDQYKDKLTRVSQLLSRLRR